MILVRMDAGGRLQPPERIAATEEDVAFHIHPEGKDHINNDGRTEREERNIEKPKPDTGRGYTNTLANGTAYAECFPFDKILKVV
jgi:hypothetical protein